MCVCVGRRKKTAQSTSSAGHRGNNNKIRTWYGVHLWSPGVGWHIRQRSQCLNFSRMPALHVGVRVGVRSGGWDGSRASGRKEGSGLREVEGGRQYHLYPTHLQIPHLSQWNTPVSPSAVLFLSQKRHTEQKYSPNATPHFVHELETGWRWSQPLHTISDGGRGR